METIANRWEGTVRIELLVCKFFLMVSSYKTFTFHLERLSKAFLVKFEVAKDIINIYPIATIYKNFQKICNSKEIVTKILFHNQAKLSNSTNHPPKT